MDEDGDKVGLDVQYTLAAMKEPEVTLRGLKLLLICVYKRPEEHQYTFILTERTFHLLLRKNPGGIAVHIICEGVYLDPVFPFEIHSKGEGRAWGAAKKESKDEKDSH
jgi:hypothetical protein